MTDLPVAPDAGPEPNERSAGDAAAAGSPSTAEQMTRELVDDVAAYEVDPPPPARARPPQD